MNVAAAQKIMSWSTEKYPHLWFPYCQPRTARCPEHVARTRAEFIELADGRQLVDGISSWWTACHGYNHPHINAAISDQLERMPHVMMGGLCHAPIDRLATRLAQVLPGDLDRLFFCDSGSVAVEVAMKIAVQFWKNQGQQGRNRFISFRNSYHGDTVGAMSVCDPLDSMHAHFKGYLLEQYPAPIPTDVSAEQMRPLRDYIRQHRRHCAAVIIEPLVQMAAGMKFHSAEVLAEIARVAADEELLLITDEVGTGFGRLGTMFACEQAQVTPDILCLGKALTGGAIGMAATAATERVYAAFESDAPDAALMHGPTFMGNPLAAAAGNASLDLFESEPRLEQVASIAQRMKQFSRDVQPLGCVRQTQVLGALLAIQTDRQLDKNAVMDFCVHRGLWLRSLGDTLYLAPPFVISDSSLELALATMASYLESLPRR